MIFVTVGAQMPFDRLIRTVDQWASQRHRHDVFAQIGLTSYRPSFMPWSHLLDPPEFRRKLQAASVVVAHAGMGSILSSLELGKPILVMPRRGDLHETRNDHQVATAQHFAAQGKLAVAFDEEQLLDKLDQLDALHGGDRISPYASPKLLDALRRFIALSEPLPSSTEEDLSPYLNSKL